VGGGWKEIPFAWLVWCTTQYEVLKKGGGKENKREDEPTRRHLHSMVRMGNYVGEQQSKTQEIGEGEEEGTTPMQTSQPMGNFLNKIGETWGEQKAIDHERDGGKKF